MNNKKHIVVLSGAGISAESGIKTFRDMGGMWEEYDVMEVASIEGWHKNKELVLNFYNQRRHELKNVEPNKGHLDLAELEKDFNVSIITQNVDNLHERAGSSSILHLHGELTKICSSGDDNYIKDIEYDTITIGDICPKGFQIRPYIVWFGEAVPAIEEAIKITQTADVFIVIGTSLQVYPAASLVNYVKPGCLIYIIDPMAHTMSAHKAITISQPATIGIEECIKLIKSVN